MTARRKRATKRTKSKSKAKRSKSGPSSRALTDLRRQVLAGAPDHPDALTPYAGETLRAELLRYAPAMPKED
jgi:hypothetical protein